jgi:tryptophan synthase beta chain
MQTLTDPDKGFFGRFGGQYIPETLMAPVQELALAWKDIMQDAAFDAELQDLLTHYVGRPTPLYEARRLSLQLGGARIFLKREDLTHTGAHKINNTLGQALLARRMGKTRVIAETGAGQHGVASATAAALLGLQCRVYMGAVDMERQALNVYRMRLLGAEVVSVDSGTATLKDAINEAMRDWVSHVQDTFYILGSVLGPHPYPAMVAGFQAVIGKEAREQILAQAGQLPDEVIACVGGGSNAIGIFKGFLDDSGVALTGVEAGGRSLDPGEHASRFSGGSPGVLHGSETFVLQDGDGQIQHTHSISAGLDYPAVGPEHAHLQDIGRVQYTSINDTDALAAFHQLARSEGILPALESSHALAYAFKRAPALSPKQILIVNLSGRGDKDVHQLYQKETGDKL